MWPMSRHPSYIILAQSITLMIVGLTHEPADHDESPQSADQNIVAFLSSLISLRICYGL
jgi:hypothetical protein